MKNFDQSFGDVQIVDYYTRIFPFREAFSNILGTDDLENLHSLRKVTLDNIAQRVTEVRQFCERNVSELQILVERFVESIVTVRFGHLVGWQQLPTIRFHFSVQASELESERRDISQLDSAEFLTKYYMDGKQVGMLHRDRDYGLAPGSVNLWIPVTNAWGSNSLWVGGTTAQGRDAQPVVMRYGQALFFDGADRWHGAVWNTSGYTRVSFDLRFRTRET